MAHVEDRWFKIETGPDGKKTRVKTALHGTGMRYRVRYIAPDGRERSKSFPDREKRAADAFLVSIESDKLRGSYIDPVAGRITFREYAEHWLRTHVVDESSREGTEYRIRGHVLPYFGDRQLSSIKPSDIREWDQGLVGKLAVSTRSVTFAHLRSIFSAAVDDERIAKNPCSASSVKQPRPVPKRVVPWTIQQVTAIRHGLAERYRLAVDLGAGCGMRQGEIFGLGVDDIELGGSGEGWIHVQRQIKIVRNRLVFGLTKNNRDRRIPASAEVGTRLLAHMQGTPPLEITLPWEEPAGKLVTVMLVLTSTRGNAIKRWTFDNNAWHPALRRAGIKPDRSTGMHALRHLYASTLLDAGESIKALAEYLGHSDPAFTLRQYTHLMPTSETRSRAAIDNLFRSHTA
ncbi:tyrosine-type recombinase/integrase [Catellatospora coxensis]|uniref:Site-specific recombinase XerD n=1 Tax=Catellatospora coxensis TaxID=310354 RepID=A0A8J3L9J8_9ACTN|nr:site-specific integrase [Catellatospora coxensis]GIG11589.1 hypothetical protein Cco03nite_82890 [Catellatospora coxensis]